MPQRFIKNYDRLATNENRKMVLELIEAAFAAITPQEVFKNNFSLENKTLKIQKQTFDLNAFERVILVGYGKGSGEMCQIIEETLGDSLTGGFDIDVVDAAAFTKVKYTKGTHPLPSEENIQFTSDVLSFLQKTTEKDLILVVICGGGSVLFEAPYKVDLSKLTKIVDALLKSGANIAEMNVIRKHLSRVKGGGLAKILYPATIVSLIFSDVPGNDLSVIASGTTVKDPTTLDDVKKILSKYKINEKVQTSPDEFTETATEDKYFEKVHNILMLSNHTALDAMEKKARSFGYQTIVWTDRLQGDARTMGEKLINETPSGHILLAGGETTIKITGNGKGGRNQALVLSTLDYLAKEMDYSASERGESRSDKLQGRTIEGSSEIVLATFDSDGWDFYGLAGALADGETLRKVDQMQLDASSYLADDNSYEFFQKVGDGIETGHLESNVSDLFIVLKK